MSPPISRQRFRTLEIAQQYGDRITVSAYAGYITFIDRNVPNRGISFEPDFEPFQVCTEDRYK